MSTPAPNRCPHSSATRRGRLLLLRALGVSVALAFASPALACPCTPPAPDQALMRASAVFEGTAEEIRSRDGGPRVQFRVTRSWRGPEREVLTVTTPQADGCGLSAAVGSTYLIYASGPDDALRADRCGGSKPISDAQQDLNVIGIGAVPVEPPSKDTPAAKSEPPARGGCASCHVGGHAADASGLGLALATIVAMRLRRRRARPPVQHS